MNFRTKMLQTAIQNRCTRFLLDVLSGSKEAVTDFSKDDDRIASNAYRTLPDYAKSLVHFERNPANLQSRQRLPTANVPVPTTDAVPRLPKPVTAPVALSASVVSRRPSLSRASTRL